MSVYRACLVLFKIWQDSPGGPGVKNPLSFPGDLGSVPGGEGRTRGGAADPANPRPEARASGARAHGGRTSARGRERLAEEAPASGHQRQPARRAETRAARHR